MAETKRITIILSVVDFPEVETLFLRDKTIKNEERHAGAWASETGA